MAVRRWGAWSSELGDCKQGVAARAARTERSENGRSSRAACPDTRIVSAESKYSVRKYFLTEYLDYPTQIAAQIRAQDTQKCPFTTMSLRTVPGSWYSYLW